MIPRLLITLLFAAAATAQSKAGDFEVKPLPAQVKSPSKTRAVARNGQPNPRACDVDICNTAMPHACVQVEYPETAWRTCISNQGRRGLVLGPTDLRRNPNAPWMRILREGSVGEIFVPYHTLPLRLFDHQTTEVRSIREVTEADAGAHGELLTLSGSDMPVVVTELKDRGVAWLCKEGKNTVRRGQELVLWGVQDAANYDFITEYRLRDDGSISFRVGATGYNNPFFPPQSTTDGHMHDILWRVDVDLNGADGDSAVLLTHREGESAPFLVATDVEEPFNNGREGTAVWDPKRFTTIGVEDETTNSYGNKISYLMRPSVEGLARHYGEQAGRPRERFTQFDFAVTKFKQNERDLHFDSDHRQWLHPDQYLLGEVPFAGFGVSDGESVEETDIILWYRSATHHDPHDEDHAPGDPANLMTGITFVHWTGFELEPRNLFDFNPLGGPSRVNCQ
jgi:primary-amine oxidase